MKLETIIKEYRRVNELSMQTFADRCGLSKGYISMLEKGTHPQNGKRIVPSLDTLLKLSNAMNMSLEDLLRSMDNNQEIDVSGITSTDAELPTAVFLDAFDPSYLSFMKDAQDEGIDTDDIMRAIELVRKARESVKE